MPVPANSALVDLVKTGSNLHHNSSRNNVSVALLAIDDEIGLTRLVEIAILYRLHDVYDHIAPEKLKRWASRSRFNAEEYEQNLESCLLNRGNMQVARFFTTKR